MIEIRSFQSADIPFALEQTSREGWFTCAAAFESYFERKFGVEPEGTLRHEFTRLDRETVKQQVEIEVGLKRGVHVELEVNRGGVRRRRSSFDSIHPLLHDEPAGPFCGLRAAGGGRKALGGLGSREGQPGIH